MNISEILTTEDPQVFCDLDGVLADFDTGAEKVLGKPMRWFEENKQLDKAWEALEAHPNFFGSLEFLPDATTLWNHILEYKPVILTGIPRGTWAAQQKQDWCKRMLGPDVPVITCASWEKAAKACEFVAGGLLGDILIDDHIKAKEDWVKVGGLFVHHTSAASSITAFEEAVKAWDA